MIYLFSIGEDSDYAIYGVYEGPEDLDTKSIIAEYERVRPARNTKNEKYFDWEQDFCAYVGVNFGLKPVDYEEWRMEVWCESSSIYSIVYKWVRGAWAWGIEKDTKRE